MNKRELKKLQWLKATEEILCLAKEDIPLVENWYGTLRYVYQRGLYITAAVEDRYLKVALFLPESLSLDGAEPMYSLFIDKEAETFIGYDHICKKWRSAVLDRIKSPYSLHKALIFCNERDTACIQTSKASFDHWLEDAD